MTKQRVFIINNYFKYDESFAEVGRKFRTEYGRGNCSSTFFLRNWRILIELKIEETKCTVEVDVQKEILRLYV